VSQPSSPIPPSNPHNRTISDERAGSRSSRVVPDIEPYERGLLDVGDGNSIYWEANGNPVGKPALVVYCGPGSGGRRVRFGQNIR
jgi:hypothetical protein